MQKYLLFSFFFSFINLINTLPSDAFFNNYQALLQSITTLNTLQVFTADNFEQLKQYETQLKTYQTPLNKIALSQATNTNINKSLKWAETTLAQIRKEMGDGGLISGVTPTPDNDFADEDDADDKKDKDQKESTTNAPQESKPFVFSSIQALDLSPKTAAFVSKIIKDITERMGTEIHIPEENFDLFIEAVVNQSDPLILDELQIKQNGKAIEKEALLQIATIIVTTSNIEPEDAVNNQKILEQMKMLDAVITCKKAYVRNAFSDFWEGTKKLIKTALIKNPLSNFLNKLLTNVSGDRQVRLIKSAQTIEQALAIEKNFIENYKTTVKKGERENDQKEIGSALGTALEKKFQELFNKAIAIRDRATLSQLKNLALTNEMVKDRKLVTPEMLTEIDTALTARDSYNPRTAITDLRRPRFEVPKPVDPKLEPKKGR